MSASEVELGHVTFLVKADERHLNPMGSVYGRFTATVLDSVTGCAIFSMLEAGLSYTTIDLNIKMCRPILLNTELKAVARTLNISKKLGIAEAQLLDQDGKLYAHDTATCMIIH